MHGGERLDLGEVRVQRSGTPLQPAGISFPLGTPAELKAVEAKVSSLRTHVLPAVVDLATADGGSGVVVSEDGYVMTAAHCLDRPGQQITLRFRNGTTAQGKVLGVCPTLDIGLVKITETGKRWPFVERGCSGNLKPGAWCVAVGYPGRYHNTVTPVVCIGRVVEAAGPGVLSVGPMAGGDSGGPLFDLEGRVIGVMQGMTVVADVKRGIAIDAFKKNWQRLLGSEFWEVVLPEVEER